jgi:hypothetical protein
MLIAAQVSWRSSVENPLVPDKETTLLPT